MGGEGGQQEREDDGKEKTLSGCWPEGYSPGFLSVGRGREDRTGHVRGRPLTPHSMYGWSSNGSDYDFTYGKKCVAAC